MHILFLSDNFYPETNAPAIRLYEHAKTWVKLGHQVTVITCAPNFPGGKLFDGYKNKWRHVELISGIRVVRIKTFIAKNAGFAKRMIDFASFALHAAVQGLFIKKMDVVIGTSPQPLTIFAAWFIARCKRKPFVFELRDLWPESLSAVGAISQSNRLTTIFSWAVDRMYQSADLIISLTDSFKKILVEHKNIFAGKIVICKNGVDFNEIKPTVSSKMLRKEYKLEGKYVVGYIGTIGMAHSVQTIIQAAQLVDDESLHFIIMGAGAHAEAIKQQASSLKNVNFIDSGCRSDAINVLNMLDASIVHLKNSPLFKFVIPSKIFESMALRKPILLGVKGESEEIVLHQACAGWGFEPQNASSLLQAIQQSRNSVYDSEKPFNFVKENFDRNKIATFMLEKIITLKL